MDKNGFLTTQDASKRALILPQIMLDGVNLWPKRKNAFTKFAFWVMLTLITIIEIGQLIYFIINISDIAKMASTMSTLSTTFQAITKMLVLHVYSDKLNAIIDTIKKDFWPSDILNQNRELQLKSQTKLVVSCMCMVCISALIFAYGFLSTPLRDGDMTLPFASWYPFNWQLLPLYEFIYLTHWIVNVYVIITTICGHDFFFLAAVSNCVAQFKLLKDFLRTIGEKDQRKMKEKLMRLGKEELIWKYDDFDEELMVVCILHHKILMKVCDDLKTVFTTSLFVQLLASVMAICVSSFLITVGNIDPSQISHLISYCLGHVLQLYLFCAAANELTYQSTSLSKDAFQSKWYKKLDKKIIKIGLIMLMQRSHKGNTITALGVANLNQETFVSVLRLSFSFYTLLSNMTMDE